jgi:hypothetical protein
LLVSVGCTCGGEGQAAPPITYTASRATGLTIDGEPEEPVWTAHEPTARFVDALSGELIPPYTEARALCDDEALYFVLYAADEDLRSTDRMGVILHAAGQTHLLEIDPGGTVRWHAPLAPAGDAPAGVMAGVDRDGTLDHEDIDDEEWIAEIRVPWSALGLSRPGDVRANFFRRDQPRNSPIRTLAWTPWRDHTSTDVSTLGLLRCASPS